MESLLSGAEVAEAHQGGAAVRDDVGLVKVAAGRVDGLDAHVGVRAGRGDPRVPHGGGDAGCPGAHQHGEAVAGAAPRDGRELAVRREDERRPWRLLDAILHEGRRGYGEAG
jgi:hypothetical protein